MDKRRQQIVAYAFGVVFVIVMLAIAIFVPNPTPFQYLVFRIVLALASAGIAAMVPGFIQVNIPKIIRAGGALAVFVIVFFYNPAALVSSPDNSGPIEPLKPPIKDLTPKQSSLPASGSTNLSLAALMLPNEAKAEDAANNEDIKVVQLLEGHSKDEASRIFDLTISNASDTQLLLTTLEVKWRYDHGIVAAASVDSGAALVPIAKYIIDFPVDTADEQWKTFAQLMSPSIALAPGTPKNPTLVTLRLQLHYHFADRRKYHPSSNWNILFEMSGVMQTGQQIPIFKDANWRYK